MIDRCRGEGDADLWQFDTHIPTFYPLVTDLLAKDVPPEMRLAVRDYLRRVGEVRLGLSPSTSRADA